MEKSQKMKVLYVITKANWGGAQRYVYDLATALPEAAFDVAVAFGQPGQLAEKLHAAEVRTLPILSLERDVSFLADAKSFFELARLFRAEKPDVVHVNSSKAAGIGALAARLIGVPRIIFTVHGWPFLEPRSAVNRAFMYFFSWLTALLSHAVIVVSEHDLAIARRMPCVARKIVRIYNGIDPHPHLGSGERIRSAFPAGARITGTIGELTRNKNHISLLKEAQKDPELHVAIVGEGELRAWLEAKIKECGLEGRVKLFGFIPAREALRGFDTFALPSLKEGLPYVLLEAKAAGLPIVANRVGGVGEILDAKDMNSFSLERMVEKTVALYRLGEPHEKRS